MIVRDESSPWEPFIREYKNKKAAGGEKRYSLLAPAGVAAARRLHEEAELSGHCTCGLVRKARCAQPLKPENEERPKSFGLYADRASTMPHLMKASALPRPSIALSLLPRPSIALSLLPRPSTG